MKLITQHFCKVLLFVFRAKTGLFSLAETKSYGYLSNDVQLHELDYSMIGIDKSFNIIIWL